MRVGDFRKKFREALNKEYASEEVDSFFTLLSESLIGMTRLQLALQPEKELSKQELEQFKKALERLLQHEPIQYIIGKTEFFGLHFRVNQDVLIPRPETEELVEWILNDFQGKDDNLQILDIGTGSGCIAISLAKKLPKAKVTAIDISEGALEIARSNAGLNEVQVEFLQEDLLKMQNLPKLFDIIVSNPPYVRELEKEEMQRNVLNYEPPTALYVKDEDPLLFYKKISDLAVEGLTPEGALYFEINQYLGEETEVLLKQKNFHTSLKKDIFGVHRMLRGKKQ